MNIGRNAHLTRHSAMAIVFVVTLVASFFAMAPTVLACHSQILVEKIATDDSQPPDLYTVEVTGTTTEGREFTRTVEVPANGSNTIDRVPPGTYTISELDAPIGATVLPDEIVVTHDDDGATFVVVVTNPAGKLAIEKIETGDTAPGGTYTFDIDGPDEPFTTTVEAGTTWTSDWLPLGDYTITERDAPTGHTGTPTTITLTEDGATVTITATNPYRDHHGKLAIQKIESGNPVEVGSYTFDVTGPVSFTATVLAGTTWTSDWLPLGTYTVTERDAPLGHTIHPDPAVLVVDGATVTVVVTNPTLLGSSGTLPATGDALGVLPWIAAALLMAGSGMLIVARGSRHHA